MFALLCDVQDEMNADFLIQFRLTSCRVGGFYIYVILSAFDVSIPY